MGIFLIGIILFFTGGIASSFFNENSKGKVFLFFAVLSQIFLLPDIFSVLFSGNQLESSLTFSEPIGISLLRLDPLAALFALIISLGSLLASIYSIGYMKMYYGERLSLSSYYFFLGLMTAAMLLVVIVQNAILFLIAWEIMSIASFFLVSFENKKENVRKAGIYYLTAMQIGAAFLIAAFSWASASTGSLDFNSFSSVLRQSSEISALLFILFFVGFGTKAGFIPMHTWLPKAHPAAPTGVSALMSGVMIKTGIYGILRILLLSGTPSFSLAYIVFTVGLLTGIIGIINAVSQKDIKKLLAYSSIENIGIIGMGIGLGMLGLAYNNSFLAALGFFGGMLHILNHFTFKSTLFYGAGVVYSQTHTRNIDKLGGLVKHLPKTSVMFLIASLAICGLPILNGFISEFAIYLGMAKSFSVKELPLTIFALLGIAGLALIGTMALLSFTKLFGIAFLGSSRSEFHNKPNENEKTLLLPMGILVVIMFVIGLSPWLGIILLKNVAKQFLPVNSFSQIESLIPLFNSISLGAGIFLIFIIILFALRTYLLKNRKVETFKTWDCGYQAESSRIQYTSSSYVQPFLNLVAELVPQKIKIEKEKVLFPKSASLESHTQDFSERFIIHPSLNYLNRFMNMFSWIQSGRMQQYIIYGLLFLIFLLIWIFGAK
ncbi:MAG: hypothetical protein C4539_02280 [Ignavibacteriales bacterium]|nr:MAG: hypothetical protein C4539_02280 [Ignavibacteriales bacterium]